MYHNSTRRIFEVARKEATRSTCVYRLGAVVVNKNIIGRGRNSKKSHPIMSNYAKWCHTNHILGTHAELHAILQTPYEKRNGADIYVCRVLLDDKFVMAKPCDTCYSIIKDMGIRRIFYTIDENEYGVIQ